MKNRREIPYLRLLPPGLSSPACQRRDGMRTETQLSLPYFDTYTIVLANVENYTAWQFELALKAVKPRWVVDARVSPRFDSIAGTRSQAFRTFGNFGATYIDLFGQLGLYSYRDADVNPEFWGCKLFRMIQNSRDASGPFLILLEDTQLLEASKTSLASKFKAVFEKLGAPSVIECDTALLANAC